MKKGDVLSYLHGDHLGSTVLETGTSGAMTADQQYYAYGRQRDTGPVVTDQRFTGQKQDATGLQYFNARYYDPEIGQFISPDTIVPDPGNLFDCNRYMYVRGRVMNASDPTGHRLYFAAGAGHDPNNTGYPQMMTSVFAEAGIQSPVDIQAHGNKWSDVAFTVGDNSKYPAGQNVLYTSPPIREGLPTSYGVFTRPVDWRVEQAVNEMSANLRASPLGEGEQLNLLGYSTGSVIMAQSALQMANSGHVIDNLILVGSPIQNDSELFQALLGNHNIKNIMRVDIPGDDVNTINQNPLNAFSAAISFATQGDNHPHFIYAFGANAPQHSRELANQMMQQGVR